MLGKHIIRTLVLWAVALAILTGATTGPVALAQEPLPYRLFGDAKASFGTYSEDDGDTAISGYATMIEANLQLRNVDYNDAEMYYELHLIVEGREGADTSSGRVEDQDTFATGQLQTARLVAGWNAAPNFAIEIGKTGGIDVESFSDMEVIVTPDLLATPVGGFNGEDDGSLNLIYHDGAIRAGVALISDCQPGCGDADYGRSTILPYFKGAFGAVTVGIRAASASGTVDDGTTTETVSTSAAGLSASFEQGDIYVGVDVESITEGCTGTGCFEVKTQILGVGFQAFNIYGHYAQSTTTDEDASGDEFDDGFIVIYVGYAHEVSNGTIYPEFLTSTTTFGEGTQDDLKAQSVRLTYEITY